jgi:hypothetical protein
MFADSNSVAVVNQSCQRMFISIIIASEEQMKPLKKEIKIERPQREKIDREQALKRVKAFPKRKEKLIASIKEGTH